MFIFIVSAHQSLSAYGMEENINWACDVYYENNNGLV